jgi:spore coat protein U-like protein
MKMHTSVRLTFLALLACLINTPTAYADTQTTTFTVTATVPTVCSVTATNLGFGTYVNVQIDATSTVSVTCTSGGAYTVGLNDGANPLAGQRRMRVGLTANYLNYELYKDAPGGTRWGDSDPSWVSGTGSGSAQGLTVHGRLPGTQGLIAGSYTDSITATVTYTP